MPPNPYWINKNWDRYVLNGRANRAANRIARAYRARLVRKQAIRVAEFGKSYRAPWMRKR